MVAMLLSLTSFTTLHAQLKKTKHNKPVLLKSIAREDKLKIVANYFEYLFKTRDFASLQKIIAKDAVYTQAEGLPYGGTYTGFSEWVNMYTKAAGYFDLQIEKEPVYFVSDKEDNVIINFTIRCKMKKTGKEISMPVLEYFEVKDGLIKAVQPFYFDTKIFTEAING